MREQVSVFTCGSHGGAQGKYQQQSFSSLRLLLPPPSLFFSLPILLSLLPRTVDPLAATDGGGVTWPQRGGKSATAWLSLSHHNTNLRLQRVISTHAENINECVIAPRSGLVLFLASLPGETLANSEKRKWVLKNRSL